MRCYCVLILLLRAFAGAQAATNEVAPPTNAPAAALPGTTNAVEIEFRALMAADDQAQEEVDRWIREHEEFVSKGAGTSAEGLNRRILERFARVRTGYEEFIKRNPDHVRVRVAYGSFLGDINEEEDARVQLEKALELNSKDPVVYNNLAGIYGHIGPDVKKAFEYYAKAIELSPNQALYYRNFATTVFLFRVDAAEYFKIEEPQVFDKALDLYGKAAKLDPSNFELASDLAQTYYGISPLRLDAALRSWTNAFVTARDQIERDGVHLHFARLKLHAGQFEEARGHLGAVTNSMFGDLKKRLTKNLDDQEQAARKEPEADGKGRGQADKKQSVPEPTPVESPRRPAN